MSRAFVTATVSLLLAGILCDGETSAAESTPPVSDVAAQISAVLRSRFPSVNIEHVSSTPMQLGLYEIVTSTGIAYTNASADFLISGVLVDTRTHENLTA